VTEAGRRRWKAIAVGLGGAALALGLLTWFRHRVDARTLQRRIWNPLYDRLAPLYDALDWVTLGVVHRLRQRTLRYLPPEGSRVLEIGIGGGRLLTEMAHRYRTAGVDLAPGMVRLARRRLTEAGLRSHLAVGHACRLPWAGATFDAVVSTFVFSALPDGEAAMAEMARVVRPEGRVIVVDAGEAADGNPMAHLLSRTWTLVGDTIRNEIPLMRACGLVQVRRDEYGPWNHIHATVGVRPAEV
jgi:ubiquinone/menaquinone biosynthesis C-methylase UbiE